MLGFPKSWVQLPQPSVTCPYNNCNEVCYCNSEGELQQCHSPPLQPFESCRVGHQLFGKIFFLIDLVFPYYIFTNLINSQSTELDCRTTVISASAITVSSFALVIDATTQLVPSFGAVHYSQIPCVPVQGNVTSTRVFLSGRE